MEVITQTTVNCWAAHLSVGGLRRWWVLGSLTRRRDHPAAAHLLAQCLKSSAPLTMFQRAEKALRRITSPTAINAVIDCWLENKAGETVLRVIEERGWRHSDEAQWLKFLTKRIRFDEYFVAELVPLINNPEVARMLAHPEGANASQTAAGAAAIALGQISVSETMDAVIDCWLEAKAGETVLRVIKERGWRHSDEAQWLKFLNKRSRFDEYFVSELAPLINRPEVARMLAHPEGANASTAAAEAATAALGRISETGTIDAVIDCWLEDKAGETVLRVIEERGWRHSDQAKWLQFLGKRSRFDEYFVAQLASRVNEAAIVRMLAHPEGAKVSITAAEAAAAALGQISAPEAVDAVIDCWLEDRAGETVLRVIEERGWRHSDEARWLKFLTQRNRFDDYFVAELGPLVNQPAVARMLAHPEAAKASKSAAEAAAASLRQISTPDAMDAVIDYWLEGKAGETARLVIEERKWRNSDEAQWLKFLTQRNRFDEYFVAELAPLVNQPAIARMLAHPEGAEAKQAALEAAADALRQISSPEAVDAVIDCWMENRVGKTARHIIEERGWRHSDEARWLKFLTQRNRFDEYFVAELAPLINRPKVAQLLAHPEGANADKTATEAAAVALGRITETGTIDSVIDYWLEGKAGETARLVIEERKWRHSDEAQWLKFLTQRNRFDEYFVAELAPLVNQPAIARMLAHPKAAARASKSATEAAADALRQISSPEAVDAVIDCWMDGWAGVTVRRVIEEQKWRHSDDAAWLNLQTKRFEYDEDFVTKLAPLVNQPTIARLLAHRYHHHSTTESAAVALGRITETGTIDAVIDYWLEGKVGETARLVIEERKWRHSDEAQWLKFLTQRNRFDEYFVAELAPLVNQPAIARMLAHPEGANADKTATEAAAVALGRITETGTIDAVIDYWLEGKAGETVRRVIREWGWRHSQEVRWFLYLAATGRFDDYLAEDYEFQTLRPEFLAAPAALKSRIREAVVKAGEVRMNGLFLAEKRAAELTVADAEALVHINIRNHNWEALFGNLWWLPARQTLDAVQAITAAKWQPDDADQVALLTRLGELAPLLVTGASERADSLPLNPVYQKWLTSGETGPLSQKSPADLKAMIEDETDPPDQIAVLGALRKQGQLDIATVAKAGVSEHWMVRWVAVHFGADLTQAMRVNDAGIEWFRRLAILRNDGYAEALWTAKPCEVTRDGLEALREHLARLPNPRAAGGLLLVEAIYTHYTANDIEVEEGARVMVAEDSFELEG